MEYTVEVAQVITVTPRRIADVIVTAVEGGIAYWCSDFLPEQIVEGPYTEDGDPTIWYNDERVWADPNVSVKVRENEPTAGQNEWSYLTASKIRLGLEVMASRYPRHFSDLVEENDDAYTADLFVQLCLFGEEVYG